MSQRRASGTRASASRQDLLHSVVIPTHNRCHLLPAAVASVQAQTVEAVEIIVVDDGSTDATPEIMARLVAEVPRLQLIRQSNRGLAAARNAGLAAVRAPWVGFLDDDDLWHPSFLATMLQRVQSTGVDAAACLAATFRGAEATDALAVLGDPAVYGLAPWPPDAPGDTIDLDELVFRPLAPINAGIFSSALLRDLGGFDESLTTIEDYDLWLRLAHRGPIPVVRETLALVRRHPEQMSQRLGPMAANTRAVLERLVTAHPGIVARVGRSRLRRRLGHLAREEAYAALLSGDRGAALRPAFAAVCYRPGDPKAWSYLACAPSPALYRLARRLIRGSRPIET